MAYIADILSIVVPTKAIAGETVPVKVLVKNLGDGAFYITVTGRTDTGIVLPFLPVELVVLSKQIVTFESSFIMPSKSVRVMAWSWYSSGGLYMEDDYHYIDIELQTLISEFSEFAIVSFGKA